MKGNPTNPEEPEKAYARNQVSEVWPLEKFSKHIADHNGVYSRGTVKGAESIDKFTSKNIKAVNILFAPGTDFENLINYAEFNPVASRVAQAATLKAEKAGESVVDLDAAKNK